MAEFDLSAYLGVFLDEVDEQLQTLDTEILRLEQDPSNEETIQNIFRAAHTLKGSSASMGFEKLKELTHYLESIFEQIREHKKTVTPDLINEIFQSIDFIRQLKQAIIDETLDAVDIAPFIERLIALAEQTESESKQSLTKSVIELDDYQKNVILKGIKLKHNAFSVNVELVEDAQMKSVRALIVQNNLKKCGEIIASFPSIEDIENEDVFDGTMTFILLTFRTSTYVSDSLQQITDIKSVHVEEVIIPTEAAQQQTVVTPPALQQEVSVGPSKEEKVSVAKKKIASTVRVDVDKLEHLMNLVGELVIDQTRLVDVRGRFTDKVKSAETEFEILDDVTNHLSRVISELQEGMMKTRMLPIEQLFNRFPRMVRDTAIKANKEITFLMEGKETELDRTLIEEISDPIIHLLRNAIDHGIEPPAERLQAGKLSAGQVILRAAHEENHVVISITDDGRGINPEKIKQTSVEKGVITEEEAKKMSDKDAMFLIFKSGISTAEKITDISGRGVGMDIVKAHIEKLKGIIDIDSEIGRGTTFTIKLPLTLAIIRSLLVKFGAKTFAIPLVNVLEIIRLNKSDIQMVKEQEVGMIRGSVLPLVRMKEHLGIEDEGPVVEKKREFVIIVGVADKRIGIIADRTIGNQEIVIKSLGAYIGSPPFISGATIMGDGSIALILDVSSIVKEYGTQMIEQNEQKLAQLKSEEKQLVTFKLDDEEYGLEIQRAKDIIAVPVITKMIETSDELLGIINLRGTMLPVIDLRARFHLPPTERTKKSRIIVVENKGQDIGFLVDEVTQVLKISDLSIERPTEGYNYQSSLIKGVSKLKERVVLILEFEKILSSLKLTESQIQEIQETFQFA